MKQIDGEDEIVAMRRGVRPGLRLGEVDVDGVPDIGIGALGLHFPDRLEQVFVVIGGLKPDVRKMRREIVGMRAAAAREFERIARRRKELLEHIQNGVAVALCCPIHIGAEGIKVAKGPHARHEALHLTIKYYYLNSGTGATAIPAMRIGSRHSPKMLRLERQPG